MLLENKNAVIYGGAGAIGGAVARAFANEGAKVFLAGRTNATLDAVAQEIVAEGGSAEIAIVDALDETSIEQHAAGVVKQAGTIDISFNAIGIPHIQGKPLVEFATEDFTLPLANVATTQFLTTRTAARWMIKQGSGAILLITATPARMPLPFCGCFGVACAALEGLTRSLAAEVGPHGVRVVCLRSAGSPDAPGVQAAFKLQGEARGITREEWQAELEEPIMLRHMPSLAEVANVATFMASDRASVITATVVNVSCGAIVD